jgi:hypothetical protein
MSSIGGRKTMGSFPISRQKLIASADRSRIIHAPFVAKTADFI